MNKELTPEEKVLIDKAQVDMENLGTEFRALMEKYNMKSWFLSACDEVAPCPDKVLFGSCKGLHVAKVMIHGIDKRYLPGYLDQAINDPDMS